MDPSTFLAASAIILLAAISLELELLDFRATIASVFVGICVLAGGWRWLALLVAFFLMASLATKLGSEVKRSRSVVAWEGTRTWRNVLANGVAASALALAEALHPSEVFVAGFVGAVSVATADTLATELGMLYPHDPRLIVGLKPVPPGTPGAISPLGELSAISGSLAIGLLATLLDLVPWTLERTLTVAILAGMLGLTLDSLLGSTVQAIFRCKACGKLTERSRHCGSACELVRGIRLIDNNAVNFLSIALGSISAMLLAL